MMDPQDWLCDCYANEKQGLKMDESKLGYYIPELVDAREKTLSGRIAELEKTWRLEREQTFIACKQRNDAWDRIAGLEALLREAKDWMHLEGGSLEDSDLMQRINTALRVDAIDGALGGGDAWPKASKD